MRNEWIATGLMLLVLPLVVAGCGGEPGGTPSETFDAWREAMLDGDGSSLFELIRPSEIRELEGAWESGEGEKARKLYERASVSLEKSEEEVRRMSFRDCFVALFEKSLEKLREEKAEEFDRNLRLLREAVVLSEEIDDERGTAVVRFQAGENEDTMRFYREDGRWYVRLGVL